MPEQSLVPQIDALKAAGCSEIFEDCVSGAKTDRPGLNEALDHQSLGDRNDVWSDAEDILNDLKDQSRGCQNQGNRF